MKESSFCAFLRGKWNGLAGVRIMRVENPCLPGTPDLCIGYGGRCAWLEVKQLQCFPVRPATPVRIEHFTSEQRDWLREWGSAIDLCYLIVRVDRIGVYLFGWRSAAMVGSLNQYQWDEEALLFIPLRSGDWGAALRVVFKVPLADTSGGQ